MNTLFSDKFFYHVYPLGLCGCPARNDFACPAGNAFETLTGELGRIRELGANALYIGPLFESSSHGYDTVDYYHVDRRLGNNASFASFCAACHKEGIAVVLDAVLNHTGRDFFAFKDIQRHGQSSEFKDWYLNLRFDRRSEAGDCFDYDGWAGCKDLVKLNVDNPKVREHLLGAVDFWIREFGIDGLRLDAADVISKTFLDALSAHCKRLNPGFWLMGEVVHGDYNDWAREGRLDSVTNYQIYKSLWSALNEKNMFELSYNLNREFGKSGLYTEFLPYNFLDNHDVDRIASVIGSERLLHLAYGLLFTIPGIPSVYYGSEKGIRGTRGKYDDLCLRPPLPPFSPDVPGWAKPGCDPEALTATIARFAALRARSEALRTGDYTELSVKNLSLSFRRASANQEVIVAVNADEKEAAVDLGGCRGRFQDILNGGIFQTDGDGLVPVPPAWLRVLERR